MNGKTDVWKKSEWTEKGEIKKVAVGGIEILRKKKGDKFKEQKPLYEVMYKLKNHRWFANIEKYDDIQ